MTEIKVGHLYRDHEDNIIYITSIKGGQYNFDVLLKKSGFFRYVNKSLGRLNGPYHEDLYELNQVEQMKLKLELL